MKRIVSTASAVVALVMAVGASFILSAAVAQPPVSQRAFIRVTIPAPAAEISFSGYRVTQLRPTKTYISPPLQAGKNYVYEIEAKWMLDGKPVTDHKRVRVRSGQLAELVFAAGKPEPKIELPNIDPKPKPKPEPKPKIKPKPKAKAKPKPEPKPEPKAKAKPKPKTKTKTKKKTEPKAKPKLKLPADVNPGTVGKPPVPKTEDPKNKNKPKSEKPKKEPKPKNEPKPKKEPKPKPSVDPEPKPPLPLPIPEPKPKAEPKPPVPPADLVIDPEVDPIPPTKPKTKPQETPKTPTDD